MLVPVLQLISPVCKTGTSLSLDRNFVRSLTELIGRLPLRQLQKCVYTWHDPHPDMPVPIGKLIGRSRRDCRPPLVAQKLLTHRNPFGYRPSSKVRRSTESKFSRPVVLNRDWPQEQCCRKQTLTRWRPCHRHRRSPSVRSSSTREAQVDSREENQLAQKVVAISAQQHS
jgi:hypothetical protein